jgi:hypothetical protein
MSSTFNHHYSINMRTFIIFSLSISFTFLFFNPSQAQRLEPLDISVLDGGLNLKMPFVGGLNSPQFNEADLNNDGIMDLVIFERAGDVVLPFLNGGTTGQVDYTFAPYYAQNFPRLKDWIVTRDYDGDGIMDIFAESTVPGIFGIEVHRGKYVNDELTFDLVNTSGGAFDLIYVRQSNGNFTQLYVNGEDYPAIDDVDNDGDLDVITFRNNGGYIEWNKNRSVELGYGRDSLIFEVESICYGGIYESGLIPCPTLSSGPSDCAQPLQGDEQAETRGGVHAGSTLLLMDTDNDNDMDLILGDITYDNLVLLENGNTAADAWFSEMDCDYPSYDTPAKVVIFPAAFWMDVNNDDKKDLLVAPNVYLGSENRKNVWFYENTNNSEVPNFTLRSKDFLVGDMIDLGAGASPAIADIDGDGLLDLIVGNESFFIPGLIRDPRLFYYRNVGTATDPRFQLVDDDWLRFSNLTDNQDFSLTPTFGDVDADGDQDLVVGVENGKLFFAENNGGAGNAMSFSNVETEWMDIDVGSSVTPHLADMNRDGKMDILIGEGTTIINGKRIGNINYFENQGTATDPMFTSSPTIQLFGNINTKDSTSDYSGLSAPFVLDIDGEYKILTGTGTGSLQLYGNIDGNLNGTFDLEDELYGDLFFGSETRPAIADLNNDGKLDIVIGNLRGGLNVFSTDLDDTTVSSTNTVNTLEFKVFPNPAKNHLFIGGLPPGDWEVRIFDVSGKLLSSENLNKSAISLESLSEGMYFVEVLSDQGSGIQRIVVAR